MVIVAENKTKPTNQQTDRVENPRSSNTIQTANHNNLLITNLNELGKVGNDRHDPMCTGQRASSTLRERAKQQTWKPMNGRGTGWI